MVEKIPLGQKLGYYLLTFITALIGASLWLPFMFHQLPWGPIVAHWSTNVQYLVSVPFFAVGIVLWRYLERSDLKEARKMGEMSLTISMMFLITAIFARAVYFAFVVTGQYHWGMVKEYWNPADPTQPSLWRGFLITIKIASISMVFSLVLGTLAGVGRTSKSKIFNAIMTGYVEFFRNTPLIVQLFFWYFGSIQVLKLVNLDLGFRLTSFSAGVFGLSFYTGAYISEAIRAGILSIDKGQWEAAHSLALSPIQTLQYIILPQAFRIVIPPLTSQFINLYKNSTVVMTIGVTDLLFNANEVEAQTFRGFEIFTAAVIIYLVGTLTLSAIMNFVNYLVSAEERSRGTGMVSEPDMVSVITGKIGEVVGSVVGFIWKIPDTLVKLDFGEKLTQIGGLIILFAFFFGKWFNGIFAEGLLHLPHGGTGDYMLTGHTSIVLLFWLVPISAIVVIFVSLLAHFWRFLRDKAEVEVLFTTMLLPLAPLLYAVWTIAANNSRDVYFYDLDVGLWIALIGVILIYLGVEAHLVETEHPHRLARRRRAGLITGVVLLFIVMAIPGVPPMITHINKGMPSPTRVDWSSIVRNIGFLMGGFPLAGASVGTALLAVAFFLIKVLVGVSLILLPFFLLFRLYQANSKIATVTLAVAIAGIYALLKFHVVPIFSLDVKFGGLELTFFLAAIAITASFFIGIVAGMMRLSSYPFISIPSIAYIELIRGIPLFMFIIYMFISIPQVVKGLENVDNWESALIAFTIFTSTYIAEIVRAGIQSIDSGQWEAAHSLGMGYAQTMIEVVLPQALKRMIPPIVSQFIALFKDTSLAYFIGVVEFFRTITITYNREYDGTFSLLIFSAVVYFIFSYAMSLGSEKLRRSMGEQEQANI